MRRSHAVVHPRIVVAAVPSAQVANRLQEVPLFTNQLSDGNRTECPTADSRASLPRYSLASLTYLTAFIVRYCDGIEEEEEKKVTSNGQHAAS